MDRAAADAPPRRRSSLPHGGQGPTPRSRRASDVARAEGGSAPHEEQGDGELAELSWGRWWPFAVVEPEAAKQGAAAALKDAAAAPLPPTPPAKDKDAHDASRGFLSLFAGKQAVSDAQAQADAQAAQDRLEAELLDASLDELSIASAASRSAESLALDADECPPASPPKQTIAQRRLVDKSLPPSPANAGASTSTSPSKSFLPSFSSLSGAADSASASIASTTSRMAGSTTSLLDSLTLPNPFNSSPASFFTSAAKSPSLTSPPSSPFGIQPQQQQQHRHYSTKRHPGKDEGPTAKPSDVENLVDADDRAAIQEEVEENAETFSILKDKYRAPRLPLVFCHGLFGFDSIGLAGVKPLSFSYWIGVEEALVAMGAEVMIGRVPASASIEERAKVLCQLIGERFPGREVNLIGHSMVRLLSLLVVSSSRSRRVELTRSRGLPSTGRARRPVPHLAPQADQLQGAVPDDHLDSPPRLVVRRLPPRGHPRRPARAELPRHDEGPRRARRRRGVQRLDDVRPLSLSLPLCCLSRSPSRPR